VEKKERLEREAEERGNLASNEQPLKYRIG